MVSPEELPNFKPYKVAISQERLRYRANPKALTQSLLRYKPRQDNATNARLHKESIAFGLTREMQAAKDDPAQQASILDYFTGDGKFTE